MAKGSSARKPPTAAGLQRQRRRTGWHWRLLEWANHNSGGTLAAVTSVAFVVVCSVWSPLGPEAFAKRWYQQGGHLSHCNKGMAIALGRSELRCWAKAQLPDGSVNRGLFGFNSVNHSHIPDECAFDCDCSIKEVVRLSRAGPKVWDHYANNTGVNIEKLLDGTSTPCNTVAEQMIKDGSLTMIDVMD